MAHVTRQRGRPKGTGIDDTETVQSIHALIMNNPELRPTTAIKSLGIDNESAIRRLRDKYNAFIAQRSQDTDQVAPSYLRSACVRDSQDHASTINHVSQLVAKSDAVRKSQPTQSATRQQATDSSDNDLGHTMIAGLSTMVAVAGFLAVQQTILWHASAAHYAASVANHSNGAACPACRTSTALS